MSDKSDEEIVMETMANEEQKSCSTGKPCKPHTSLYLSVIAILLAAYAAISAGTSVAPANTEERLDSLDNNIRIMSKQIAALSKDVESNRENLVQNQLKKALLNLQEIGGLAKEETKATIAEIETILHNLTSPAETAAPATEQPQVIESEILQAGPEAELQIELPATETPAEQAEAITEFSVDAITETPEEAVLSVEPETATDDDVEVEVEDEAEEPGDEIESETPAVETPTEQPEAQAF